VNPAAIASTNVRDLLDDVRAVVHQRIPRDQPSIAVRAQQHRQKKVRRGAMDSTERKFGRHSSPHLRTT